MMKICAEDCPAKRFKSDDSSTQSPATAAPLRIKSESPGPRVNYLIIL